MIRIAIEEISGACLGRHADIDPHWNAETWFEATRGDGFWHHGNLEIIEQYDGESEEQVLARASVAANLWDRSFGCARCYKGEV